MQYNNFYGDRTTRDPQGRNVQTKHTFVENVRYFRNKQFYVNKDMDYYQEKQSQIQSKSGAELLDRRKLQAQASSSRRTSASTTASRCHRPLRGRRGNRPSCVRPIPVFGRSATTILESSLKLRSTVQNIFKFPNTGGSLASMLSCSCLWGGGQVIVALGLWRRRLKRTLNTPPPPQRWKQTRKHIRGAVAPRTGTFRSARQGTPQKVYILITQVVRE